jgi:AcrR family transcriptional regulator
MPGERFSVLYMRPGDPAPDSARARHRIGSLFREALFHPRFDQLAAYLVRNIGISLPDNHRYPSCWHQFMRECRIADFIDTITVVYRYLFWHVSEDIANWWRDSVRQIMAEENLAYEIDDVGGVHPRIDSEFQRNVASALAGLEAERYRNVRDLLERASGNLSTNPPNYRQAWRATLSAMEAVFALIFPQVRFTIEEIERYLKPRVERTYQGDPTSQRAALRMLTCLLEWVEASRSFRHYPGAPDCSQPPPDVAVLSISCGASLVRWLAGLADQQPR